MTSRCLLTVVGFLSFFVVQTANDKVILVFLKHSRVARTRKEHDEQIMGLHLSIIFLAPVHVHTKAFFSSILLWLSHIVYIIFSEKISLINQYIIWNLLLVKL